MEPLQSEEDPMKGSIAFLPDGKTVAYRDSLTRIGFAEIGPNQNSTGQFRYFRISTSAEGGSALKPVTSSISYSQPPALAAVRTGDRYRIAWLTKQGVVVYESTSNGDFVPIPKNPTLSMLSTSELGIDTVRAYSQLRFDQKGDLLTLVTQTADGTAVRVWNISDSRAEAISGKTGQDLIAAACRYIVSSNERPEGTMVSGKEFDALPVSSRAQPCPQSNGATVHGN